MALTVVPPVELGIAKGLAFAHRSFGGPEEIFDPMYAQVEVGALAQGQFRSQTTIIIVSSLRRGRVVCNC